MSALEALASGLPSWRRTPAAWPSSWPNDGNRKVSPGDAAALARALEELLALRPEERATLGARNRALAETYNVDGGGRPLEAYTADVIGE